MTVRRTEDHFTRLARLLDWEAEAEARQILETGQDAYNAERSGTTLVGLVLREERVGLAGRLILKFTKSKASRPLPWTRLNSGAPILLSVEGARATEGVRGIVWERADSFIEVVIHQRPDIEEDEDALVWRIDLSQDEAARTRQRDSLQKAASAKGNRLAEMKQLLLGEREPRTKPVKAWEPINASLDESQRAAVEFALCAEDLAIIHGPPGTGKTTVVVEIIRQWIARGKKILACAPSNLAVDNLMERLLACKVQAVRLGHPARVLTELRAHTLDELADQHQDTRLAKKLVKEAFALFRQASRYTRAKPAPGERADLRQQARSLLADARKMEQYAIDQILDGAQVLCATTTGLDPELLGNRRFDVGVLDEAGQSVEPGAWPPIVRVDQLVLAGDHCQLPPTVVSTDAEREGLGISLLERMVGVWGEKVTRRLEVQYRMHEQIMGFSSSEFYDGSLRAHPSVAEHLLSDLSYVKAVPSTSFPLEFIDTAGAGHDEETDGTSRFNPGEADCVARCIRGLISAGVRPADIAVIAPYSAQVRLLREKLSDWEGMEIDSVDGFQGREKEAVVLSLVRSNPSGEVGFLKETRRMNVAMTRARRKLILIGDSATIAADPFYRRFLEYVETQGTYRTVWEEPWE